MKTTVMAISVMMSCWRCPRWRIFKLSLNGHYRHHYCIVVRSTIKRERQWSQRRWFFFDHIDNSSIIHQNSDDVSSFQDVDSEKGVLSHQSPVVNSVGKRRSYRSSATAKGTNEEGSICWSTRNIECSHDDVPPSGQVSFMSFDDSDIVVQSKETTGQEEGPNPTSFSQGYFPSVENNPRNNGTPCKIGWEVRGDCGPPWATCWGSSPRLR